MPRYRVSGLEIDLGTCEVTCRDRTIALPKLSFDLLASLVRHAPNVVTIDRLIEDVWDGRIVAEETVTQRVKLLRDALADAGFGEPLVATVRGRGYRLAAAVEQVERSAAIGATRSKLAAAAVVLLGLAAIALVVLRNPGDVPAPPGDHSIAVLPFVDFSAENDVGYVGDGIAEELLNRFAQIPGLRVASRTSSFNFRDPSEDLRSIATQLGVSTILEGSVREAGGRLRITVQLVDAINDRHLWSETFDRELADVLDIQDDVAAAVVDRFRLSPVATSPARRVAPAADVTELYLRGRHELRARTAPSLEAAIALFEQVIERQPGYAPAQASLAAALIELSRRGNLSIDEAERRAKPAINAALALDESLPEAHATLGLLRLSMGDTQAGEAALRHAIALNPNLAEAALWLGYVLLGTERRDEAIAMFERTLLLDPMNVAALDALAFDLMANGDYEATIRQFQRRIRIEDSNGESYRLMALAARTFGHLEQAVLWAREAVAADPDSPLNVNELVFAYSAIREMDLAGELAERAFERSPDNHWVALTRTFTLINAGDFASLQDFGDLQRALVATGGDGILSPSDRIRIAISGLAAFYATDFPLAQRRLERALGDPLTSVLEIQFTIGLMGALAYTYRQNGDEQRFAATLERLSKLIAEQPGWTNQRLIYADSMAAVKLMEGDRDAAIAILRQAVADGWTGHPGIAHAPLWRDFYAADAEFREIIDGLNDKIAAMRQALRRRGVEKLTAVQRRIESGARSAVASRYRSRDLSKDS